MKKVLLSCAAALAMFVMVSCSSKAEKAVEIFNDATEQVKSANGDVDKIKQIITETQEKGDELTKGMSDSEQKDLENDEKVKAAAKAFKEACEKAAQEK